MSSPVNVDIRGYGKIYKAVMRNRELPPIAKALYAYFCAFAGNSNKAFPKREKITRDLCINKDTYTKHLNTLVGKGYIGKERTSTGNLYTIIQTVPSYSSPPPADEELSGDILVMENIQAQGFGTVPKLVMLDQRLSAQAKAIYAYFASFAGAGTTAFPRHTTILRELRLTDKTYYKHFNQLLDAGYLSVEQRKVKGRFDVSLYRLSGTVQPPPLPRPGKGGEGPAGAGGAPRAMSEKLPTGENDGVERDSIAPPNIGMSGNLPSGGEPLNPAGAASQKGMSEKVPTGKLPIEKSGHANIRNTDITNRFLEKEQNHNHQGSSAAEEQEQHVFSLLEVKRLMSYDQHMDNALAWGELKETLGQYEAPGDKARYLARVPQIMEALALQAQKKLNRAAQPEQIIAVLQSEAFEEMLDEFLHRWATMRSVEGYVGRCLDNLLG